MKLRITAAQIRFRLSEQEAHQLLQEYILSETLHLPADQKLHYLVKISDDVQSMHLNFNDHTLMLTLPIADFKNLLHNPSKHGLSASYEEQDKKTLFSVEIELPASMCSH